MSAFLARFQSRCLACEQAIHEGDPARWTEGREVVHAGCPEPADPLTVERTPCPSCFQVPAANGTCGCE